MEKRRKTFFINVCINVCIFIFLINNKLEAKDTAKGLFSKSNKLIKISLGYSRLQKYDLAKSALSLAYKMAGDINEPLSKAIILYEITDKYTKLNMQEKAFQIAKYIDLPDVRKDALLNIAYSYVELGDYKKGREFLENINDDFYKAWWLFKTVNLLTELGLYEQAIELANTMKRCPLLNNLIFVQVYSNNNLNVNDNIFSVQKEPFKRAKELVDTSEKYFSFFLYKQAKNMLRKAGLISKDIESLALRDIINYRIYTINNKISEFEQKYTINK